MKKVALLGDSIKAWYAPIVKEKLDGKCEVVVFEGENGKFVYNNLRHLMNLLSAHGKTFDLVHFNSGYWDMTLMPYLNEPMISPEEYKCGLRKIIRLSRAAGAKVVFATTTPLPGREVGPDNTGTGVTFSFEQELVSDYNDAAREVMQEENVPINDLYAVCKQHERYYKCEDNLHHTPEGNEVLAQHVADAILKELNIE